MCYVVDGKCMVWKNILDMCWVIDYLVMWDEVDVKCIGCYGYLMGLIYMWLVGFWELRLKCLVGNCCLLMYVVIYCKKLLHCFLNFIFGLYWFGDIFDIVVLIVFRVLYFNFGENDDGFFFGRGLGGGSKDCCNVLIVECCWTV